MKRKICVITGTRADWGLLSGIAKELDARDDVQLQIVATNMHLSPRYGDTYREIENDGLRIDLKVPMPVDNDTPQATASAMAACLDGMAHAFDTLRPHLAVILGDRFEMLATASAALLFRLPVAHIAGGAVSFGAFDEGIRHSITKMSHLHFTETEEYRRRVIQLGEHPDRVFNVGAIGVYNIRHTPLLDRAQLEAELHTSIPTKSLFVTFHPATLDAMPPGEQFDNLLTALDLLDGHKVFFSYPNNDTHGREIIKRLEDCTARNPEKYVAFPSLGRLRYLSMLKCVEAVAGNSSSGIVEVPSMGIPTLDIGIRQSGRMAAGSVVHCGTTVDEIRHGLATALSPEMREKARNITNPYEQPDTLQRIVDILCDTPLEGITVKHFYDINQ